MGFLGQAETAHAEAASRLDAALAQEAADKAYALVEKRPLADGYWKPTHAARLRYQAAVGPLEEGNPGMTVADLTQTKSLMALWSEHRKECRPIGDIVTEARVGKLPGVQLPTKGHGFRVTDETAALAAMRKKTAPSLPTPPNGECAS